MSIRSLTYQKSIFKRYHSDKHFPQVFTYKMAAKINWHRYETKITSLYRHNTIAIFWV